MMTDKGAHLGTPNAKRGVWEPLLDELQTLLVKQIELVRQGRVSDVEALSKRADSLVAKIGRTKILERGEFKNRREQLQELCNSLCLALMAEKADTTEKLIRLRKGKKTIEMYRSNILL